MEIFFKLFVSAFLFFASLDILWIGFLARQHYLNNIGSLLRYANGSYNVVWWAGLLVWVLIALGSIIFVLPLTKGQNLFAALFYGALFGLVLYGVYDLTNYSLLKAWPLSTTLLDIAWGMLSNALLAVFVWWINNKL
jgi:uncharacterized membrane protein